MTQQETRSGRVLLRTGAATAALGVVAALVQTGINPSYPDDPSEAIRQASQSHFLTSSRVLDMSAFLLLLVGVVVITRVFSAGRGGPWTAVARALFTVSAASGAIATMIVGSLPDVAHAWEKATPALKPASSQAGSVGSPAPAASRWSAPSCLASPSRSRSPSRCWSSACCCPTS